MRPTAGMTFGGRYELQSRIAIGGMGEVWQATDLVIGRLVAIKILKDEYLGDPGFLERFRAEARHAALVNHEGIANVYDYGEEEGSAYLVMELVPGEPLSAVIEREKTLSIDKVLDIIAQTSAALQAAHSAGLVHRDIKPGNMLITPEGRVKITDFGIARIADQVPLTATGQVMGTVQYLSPEQASGHPASPSTDIYSLGIVAYECLAGKRPFTGESQVAIAMAQINEEPPPLPDTIAEPVRNLVYSCIAKKPADRPASSANLARAAQALRRGDLQGAAAAVPGVLGTTTTPLDATVVMPRTAATGATTVLNIPDAPEPVETTEKKKRSPWTWPLIALIGVLVLVLIGAVVALTSGGNSPTPAPTDTTQSASPTKTKTASPTPTGSATPTTAAINKADYVGKSLADATAALEKLNMNVNAVKGTAAPSADKVGIVYDVNPTGPKVPNGTTINVTYYGDLPVAPAPTAAPTLNDDNATPGQALIATWAGYTACPAGHSLESYTVLVDGSPVSSVPNASAPFTAPSNIGSHTIAYQVTCAGLAATSSSPTTTFTVSALG
ncbi:protein kinase domain-containing protein [Aurantimicrobium minutum]|uniref:protein kinase domain-containing protein n=1 Tax=Aurantimicrobium minutum TaxID=708131 RepID=UPI002474FD41|nr:protein kinase [Aurantimicrobium minutum]MDH6423478.1 serine/threonine protein kinase [Aurantimicrobium minutum]